MRYCRSRFLHLLHLTDLFAPIIQSIFNTKIPNETTQTNLSLCLFFIVMSFCLHILEEDIFGSHCWHFCSSSQVIMISLERKDAGLVFIINVAEFQTFHVCLHYYATRMKCIIHYISEKRKNKIKNKKLRKGQFKQCQRQKYQIRWESSSQTVLLFSTG